MPNIFQAVKATVPVPAAAERYRLQVRRGGMARCPFHEDRTPSMKIYDDHFYCFGCQAHGDVTDLTARLLGLQNYEAACKLAQDFGVNVDAPVIVPVHLEIRRFENDQAKCQRVLCEYLHLLERWRDEYAPDNPGIEPDDRYAEYCQMYSTIDYLTELLIVGDLEQRVRAVDLIMKDGKINELDRRLKRIAKEESEERIGA